MVTVMVYCKFDHDDEPIHFGHYGLSNNAEVAELQRRLPHGYYVTLPQADKISSVDDILLDVVRDMESD